MQSAPWAARLPALMKQHSMHSASASLRDQLQRIQCTSPACFIQFQESSMLLWAHSAPAPSPSRFILFIHLAAHDIASLIENWRIKRKLRSTPCHAFLDVPLSHFPLLMVPSCFYIFCLLIFHFVMPLCALWACIYLLKFN